MIILKQKVDDNWFEGMKLQIGRPRKRRKIRKRALHGKSPNRRKKPRSRASLENRRRKLQHLNQKPELKALQRNRKRLVTLRDQIVNQSKEGRTGLVKVGVKAREKIVAPMKVAVRGRRERRVRGRRE